MALVNIKMGDIVRDLLTVLDQRPRPQEELIARILEEYRDELTKEACDNCEQCGELVMCKFHSVMSLLSGETKLRGEAQRTRPSPALPALIGFAAIRAVM